MGGGCPPCILGTIGETPGSRGVADACPPLPSSPLTCISAIIMTIMNHDDGDDDHDNGDGDGDDESSSMITSARPFTFRFSAVFSNEESLSWKEICRVLYIFVFLYIDWFILVSLHILVVLNIMLYIFEIGPFN